MAEVRAVLAGIAGPPGAWSLEDEMAELGELARTAGAEPLAAVVQPRATYDPKTLFTRGKVAEIADAVGAHAAEVVFTSAGLSPRQQLRLEEAVGCNVIDRTRLILDIFAGRARSREGRIQVELAQLLYLLPRLTGLGTEMSRTGGGIGTRGPGETRLETDRRRVRARISSLRHQLEGVVATRAVQRGGRRRAQLPSVALVGYTNAGKSTLHRALCASSEVLVADQLFATLDPTTRIWELSGHRRALLTDTVGFVHDLPHTLVAAFSATLEEVRQADLLLQVVDRNHPRQAEQCAAVETVLSELGALDIPRILVWNKCDLPPGGDGVASGLPSVRVSARGGTGLDELRALAAGALVDAREMVEVLLPFGADALISAVRAEGELLESRYGAEGIALRARCGPALAARLRSVARK